MQRNRIINGMFLSFLILSACSGSGEKVGNEHSAALALPGATMRMEMLKDEGGGAARIGIVIDNPRNLPIQSVRSWVKFSNAAAFIDDLTLDDERFSLEAPGEQAIDAADGFVMIGRATTKPVTDAEVHIASFRVQKRGQEEVVLSFYDWRHGGDGHSAVLSVLDGVARHILEPPSSLTLP